MTVHKGELPSQTEIEGILKSHSSSLKFELHTDFKLEDLILKDGKLFDKKSGRQIFILKGTEYFLIKTEQLKIYENATIKLYEEMMRLKAIYPSLASSAT